VWQGIGCVLCRGCDRELVVYCIGGVWQGIGCVLYRGCDRELVWECDRDTNEHEHLRINTTQKDPLICNEYIDLKFHFNNLFKNLLLQYKVKREYLWMLFCCMNCSEIVYKHNAIWQSIYINFYTIIMLCPKVTQNILSL
jgi:hypothetical protein